MINYSILLESVKCFYNCDCISADVLNGVRQPFLCNFALDKPPGHKIDKEPGVKLLKKKNKSVLSHITFYLDGDDYKPDDFIGKTLSFNCQLIKIKK